MTHNKTKLKVRRKGVRDSGSSDGKEWETRDVGESGNRRKKIYRFLVFAKKTFILDYQGGMLLYI